jgi:hypothetical protein
MNETEYRGYRIRAYQTKKFFANIVAPGTNAVLRNIPTATLDEGEDVLLSRAKNMVDALIAGK